MTQNDTTSIGDAQGILGAVKEKTSAVADAAQARIGNAQARVADVLDSGAAGLRDHAESGTADDESSGAATTRDDSRLASTELAVAGMFERTALWLRENDLSDVQKIVTAQLEAHPLRTAFVAVAAGFLLSRRRASPGDMPLADSSS
jgi:hypothetical protein